jgi:hypothetical protein
MVIRICGGVDDVFVWRMHDCKHATWGRDLRVGVVRVSKLSCMVDIFPTMVELVYSK